MSALHSSNCHFRHSHSSHRHSHISPPLAPTAAPPFTPRASRPLALFHSEREEVDYDLVPQLPRRGQTAPTAPTSVPQAPLAPTTSDCAPPPQSTLKCACNPVRMPPAKMRDRSSSSKEAPNGKSIYLRRLNFCSDDLILIKMQVKNFGLMSPSPRPWEV